MAAAPYLFARRRRPAARRPWRRREGQEQGSLSENEPFTTSTAPSFFSA
jgi:hypothetical protein